MKKILAIMLIAVIAVAGAFAAKTPIGMAETPIGMADGAISLEYKITNSFTPAFGFTVVDEDDATVDYEGTAIVLGTNENKFAEGDTTITVYDMSYSNSLIADTNKVKLTLTAPTKWVKGTGSNAIDGPAIVASALTEVTGGATKTKYVADTGFVVTDNVTSTTDTIELHYVKGIVDYDTSATANALATFGLSWQASDQLEAGTYSASVTVEVAVI